MKAPDPTLTSSTSAPVPSAIFLLMIDDGDQWDRLDGAGHVPQRVQLPVGRRQSRPAAQITAPTSLELVEHLGVAHRRPPAGDRLQLVQRAAGVTEAAAGQLRHGDTAGRDQRRERQGDLVADPSGGVLVGGRPRQRGEVQPLAGVDHGPGPAAQLAPGQPAEEDRHGQRRHLLLGDVTGGVRGDHPVDLVVAELRPVTLGADHLDGIERCSSRAHPAILTCPVGSAAADRVSRCV